MNEIKQLYVAIWITLTVIVTNILLTVNNMSPFATFLAP